MTNASPAPAANVPAPRPQIHTGASVAALVPQTLDEAFRLAQAIASSGMAPKGIEKPEQVMVAIMAGAELGFPPFQALQSFAVVNGRPTIWGDAIPALLWSSGFKIREWFEGEDPAYPDTMKAKCEVTRPDGSVVPGEFSVADAKEAGLWSKAGPWQTAKKRMMKMRARAFTARDGAADVLRGFQVREEVEDYQQIREVGPQTTGMRARLEARETAAAGFDPAHVAQELGGEVAHDTSTGEIIEVEVTGPVDDPSPEPQPQVDDAFPGDGPATADDDGKPPLPEMKTGAQVLAEQQAAAATSPLNERIRAFKAECEGKGTVELSKIWRRSSVLRNDIEAADPDSVDATNQELEAWFNGLFDAAETKEKGAA